MPTCPQCNSQKIWKAGLRFLRDGTQIQRLLCRQCDYRFTEKQSSNTLFDKRKISVEPFPEISWNENMLLPEVGKMKKIELLREGDLQFADTRAELIRFAIHLRKRGLKESTAFGQSKLLRILWQRRADLHYPESVKETIANQESWCPGRKENAVNAYTNFLLMHNHSWIPQYTKEYKRSLSFPQRKKLMI
jgi:hypothetical protein